MPGVKAATTPTSSVTEDSATEEEAVDDKNDWVLKVIDPKEDKTSFCKLCFKPAQDEDSELRLGPLYSYGYCMAHHYCLMFSSGLNQEGEDEEGIKGFLPESIVKEWRRGSSLKCFYCKKKYATVGCANGNCKKGYHLCCGIENESLQQFFGNFASYCSAHKPLQAPVARVGNQTLKLKEAECGVCLDELEEVVGHTVLWTPCCGGWFHRSCVERMAAAAGSHHFKCPLCNNKDEFSEEMKEFGIYVPDQDAEWEAGDAFGDQLQRHDRCDAVDCLCPDNKHHPDGKFFAEGRMYDEEDTEWEIMLCVCCGHQGMHIKCGNLSLARPRWKCPFCKDAVKGLENKPVPVFTRVKRAANPPDQEFSRKILSNLTFRISNNTKISVDVHKNRKDPKDPVVARFVVEGAPHPPDVPLSVTVRKEYKEKKEDLIRNIPCSWEDCDQLLNRLEFHDHLASHRGDTVEEEEEEDEDEVSASVILSRVALVGYQVDVREASGKVYKAKVLKVKGDKCLVHFKGWHKKWDQWLAKPNSEEIEEDAEDDSAVSCQSSQDSEVEDEEDVKKLRNTDEKIKEKHITNNDEDVKDNKSIDKERNETNMSSSISDTPRSTKRKLSTESSNSSEPKAKKSCSLTIDDTPSEKAPKNDAKSSVEKDKNSEKRKSLEKEKKIDAKQSSILNFFTRFKPAGGATPTLKKKDENTKKMKDSKQLMETVSVDPEDSIEILEKVTPSKLEKESSPTVVSSSVGFFKLDNREGEEKKDTKTKLGCDNCKTEFDDQESLDRHKTCHSAKFTCQHCKMTFSSMITWKTHENGHTQNKPSCTICEETFNSEKALEKHIESKHSAKEELESDENVEITYYCDECDRTTKSSRDLKRHKTAMHRKKSTELETTPNTEEKPSKEAVAEKSSEAVEAPSASEKAPVQEVAISSSEEEKSKDGSILSQPTTSELAKIMDDWMDD